MNGSDFWKAFSVPFMLLILFVIAFFSVSKINKSFVKEPTLDIISGSEIVTDQAEVPITGVVHNTSKLTVAGKQIVVSKDGSFSTTVPVTLGENNVEIAAGSTKQAKSNIKITREEVQKSVAATSTTSTGTADLATSGPVETVMGSFGLTAIILSLFVYRRSLRGNSLQKAKNLL